MYNVINNARNNSSREMKINVPKMVTPIEETLEQNLKVRTGMVNVSDGKSNPEPTRLKLTMELLILQRLDSSTPSTINSEERMVQIRRDKNSGLGLSIKGGAEHKLPILISKIYRDQAADITGQLFVGDAIIKVNGEFITACEHDDTVNILRNAGDIVVLTVKHYKAATPFLQKQLARDTPDSDNDAMCVELKKDEGWKKSFNNSRPVSVASDITDRNDKKWVDIISVPLMMAYVTRFIYGTDKLRTNAFEVRGLNGVSSGIIHCDLAILSQWLKLISDNIVGLTQLQLSVTGLTKSSSAYKVYQTMFRVIKESETVDARQHCFLLQSSPPHTTPRYLSVETRQELLRIENSWNSTIITSVIKLGRKTFAVSHLGRSGGLTLDWQSGFSLTEGADATVVWQYKFSALRGSSDDGKSKLKLHFHDPETRSIDTKEIECQVLQSLLFCMHAFLTAKVASVDPTFLSSIQQN
ncbi:gamma-1-syntrophin isoform X5 [Sitodiplosis mosellana]|uniref:gamma-1-syntrophin isoform X5 n=1 Tax=Sitodiplosis mosellana TaxID=263140 RepID=UPI0024443565|nr:gamma-1-syntrophin isoform X5 [Sitodiplosis mosellana]